MFKNGFKAVMLPTNQKVNKGIWLRKAKFGTEQYLFNDMITGPVHSNEQYQHLYIISDDKIKEGDWCLSKLNEIVRFKKNYDSSFYKKIISTTDTSLEIFVESNSGIYTTHGKGYFEKLPQPSKEFIKLFVEEYNEGNAITDVMVEYENAALPYNGIFVIGELPTHKQQLKINPKDNTITIRKIKDSWNRKEVEILLRRIANDIGNESILGINEWIKDNL